MTSKGKDTVSSDLKGDGVRLPVDVEEAEAASAKKPEDGNIEDLKQMLQEKEAEIKKLQDRLLREQAEGENFRKRLLKEKTDLVKFAVEALISDLLPIMDDFERAIVAVDTSHDPKTLQEGVKLIFNQLQNVLNRAGLEGVSAVGEAFDPTRHEAVRLVESHEHDDSIVLEELRKGYTLNKRILRPSMVAVSKRKEGAACKNKNQDN